MGPEITNLDSSGFHRLEKRDTYTKKDEYVTIVETEDGPAVLSRAFTDDPEEVAAIRYRFKQAYSHLSF